jgi:cysteine desulfurase/selenocysteine lyase
LDRLNILPHNRLIGSPKDNWEMGARDTASYAKFTEVGNYFEWLGGHFTTSNDHREMIIAAGCAIKQHEKDPTNTILDGVDGQNGLESMSEVSIIGGIDNLQREGLVSISIKGMRAKKSC